MAKKRVYEIAKERGVSSKELLAALQTAGVDVKAAASTVDEADVARVLSGNGAKSSGDSSPPAPAPQPKAPPPAEKREQSQARPSPGAQSGRPQGGGGQPAQ